MAMNNSPQYQGYKRTYNLARFKEPSAAITLEGLQRWAASGALTAFAEREWDKCKTQVRARNGRGGVSLFRWAHVSGRAASRPTARVKNRTRTRNRENGARGCDLQLRMTRRRPRRF